LTILGSLIILVNYVRLISNFIHVRKKTGQHSSIAPIVGPVLIIFGYWLWVPKFNPFILFVLVLDPDTVITVGSLFWLLIQKIKNRKPRR